MDCKTSRFSFANHSPEEQTIITNQTYYIYMAEHFPNLVVFGPFLVPKKSNLTIFMDHVFFGPSYQRRNVDPITELGYI